MNPSDCVSDLRHCTGLRVLTLFCSHAETAGIHGLLLKRKNLNAAFQSPIIPRWHSSSECLGGGGSSTVLMPTHCWQAPECQARVELAQPPQHQCNYTLLIEHRSSTARPCKTMFPTTPSTQPLVASASTSASDKGAAPSASIRAAWE